MSGDGSLIERLDVAWIAESAPLVSRWEIVVLDRGWVLVGFVKGHANGDLRISQGAVIRVWGTTKGLGQLAFEGAQPATKLDPIPEGIIPARAVLFRLDAGKLRP
jgi:hypothetical protein